jgi:pSer/pThr/pTyr-binding forkhead associated (FHA) protein
MSGTVFLILRIAMTVALYTFLGWALLTLWKELRRQSTVVISPQITPLTLINYADGELQPLRFLQQEVTIGRDPASDLYLEDATISAQHSRLSYHHRHWWLEDLRSTNGTFLNQEPVIDPVVVTAGDQIRCGQVVLQVELDESEILERA